MIHLPHRPDDEYARLDDVTRARSPVAPGGLAGVPGDGQGHEGCASGVLINDEVAAGEDAAAREGAGMSTQTQAPVIIESYPIAPSGHDALHPLTGQVIDAFRRYGVFAKGGVTFEASGFGTPRACAIGVMARQYFNDSVLFLSVNDAVSALVAHGYDESFVHGVVSGFDSVMGRYGQPDTGRLYFHRRYVRDGSTAFRDGLRLGIDVACEAHRLGLANAGEAGLANAGEAGLANAGEAGLVED
jgi:hypothetical protein